MPIDLDNLFRRGGKELLDLLDYCVRSVRVDPVFVFLVREYRSHPTVGRALALYDAFCAPQAPARLSVRGVLPPMDLRLLAALQPLQRWRQQNQPVPPPPESALPPLLPAKYLFDVVVGELEANADSSLRTVREHYDPRRTPMENLPGGSMTAGQRHFVEKVWEPVVRPRLVAAGFRHVATVG